MTTSSTGSRLAGYPTLSAHRLVVAPCGLAVAEAGDGPAVLALHGGLGGVEQSALLDLALFGPPTGRRVLAVSRPGYPGSTAEGRGDAAAQADRFARLLDEAGLARALVVAISGGGGPALAFAERHRDRCRGLVLVSACAGPLTSPVPVLMRIVLRLRRVRPLVDCMARKMASAPIRDAGLARAVADDAETAALVADLKHSLGSELGERLGGLADDIAMCAAQATPAAGAIAVPTLLVHAVDDPIVPFALAEAAAERIAGARLVALPDGGHQVLFTRRAEIAAAVARFVARLAE